MTVSFSDCGSLSPLEDSWFLCLLRLLSVGEDLDDLLFYQEPYEVSGR